MRSVALLIAPLLTLLLYSGPALAGQRSSGAVIVNNFAGRPTFVVPRPRPTFVVPPSRVVIVRRPFAPRPFIAQRPLLFGPPFFERRVFVDRPFIVRRSDFGSPFIVQRTFAPQVLVFDRFGRPLN